jgi:hypothetical protein
MSDMAAGSMMIRSIETSSVADLASIYECDVELVVMPRTLRPEVDQFARQTVEQRMRWEEHMRVVPGDLTELDARLACLCPAWPGAAAWLEDVGELVDLFAELMEVAHVGLRVVTLSGPMCPRFHIDRIPARLLTTYAGPGTEWLAARDVRYDRLGPASAGMPDETSGLLKEHAQVRRLAPGELGLFKGSTWADGRIAGVVHRSPPGTEGRLLVSLDPLYG